MSQNPAEKEETRLLNANASTAEKAKLAADTGVECYASASRLDIDQIGTNAADFDHSRKKNLKYLAKDTKIIVLFLCLYTCQAIPYGLASAVPLILSSKKVSMKEQGILSFAFWPFALRLIYCPILDTLYMKRFGRRKTWLFPTMLGTGILMLSCANYVNDFLENNNTTANIYVITMIFAMFTVFASIQDIIQDGWLLNLLSKENLAWQSVCNSVGMTLGNFIGNPVFLTLNAPDPCNKYIRPLFSLPAQSYGILNIKNYYHVFGVVFIVAAVLVLLFKSEHRYNKEKEPSEEKRPFHLVELFVAHEHVPIEDRIEKLTVLGTVKLIWKIIRLQPMLKLMIFLFTIRLGFTAEQVIRLKLVEEGVPRERISILGLFISPFLAAIPFILIKITDRAKPLSLLMDAYNFKLAMMLMMTLLVYFTASFKADDGSFPLSYYAIYFVLNLVNSTIGFAIFFAVGSFFSQISDKTIGGTYMTFLTTVIVLGASWPRTLIFFVLDATTKKICIQDAKSKFFAGMTAALNQTAVSTASPVALSTALPPYLSGNTCSSKKLAMECIKGGGKCFTVFDSFYIITFISAIIGLIWFVLAYRVANQLQSRPKSDWKVTKPVEAATAATAATRL